MTEKEPGQGGWWGSTLSKLKSALAKTKAAVVDSVLERPHSSEQSEVPKNGSDFQAVVASEAQISVTDQETEVELFTRGKQATKVDEQELPDIVEQVEKTERLNHVDELSTSSNFDNAGKAQPVSLPVKLSSAVSVKEALPPARAIDEDYLDDLEEKLIKADLGLVTAETLVQHLRKESRAKGWNTGDVETFLKKEFASMLAGAPSSNLNYQAGKLNLYLIVGVNGTGKTTSIGKLCWRFKAEGKKVLVAAADTFRAAAESQLEIWTQRASVDIVRLSDGADPGAVVYQAINKANSESYDVLIVDTAGRLHNKANLMAELKKIRTVIEKNAGALPLESLLVLDASTGQNGLQQARVFTEVCPLTGVILTKLDGTAKGGIVFSIARELNIPVKLIGLGEKIDDLRDFEPELFVEALF